MESVRPCTGRMRAWKIWNITGILNAARALILLDVLKFFRLRVSRNRKFYSIMALWDKKYKNQIWELSSIFRFLYYFIMISLGKALSTLLNIACSHWIVRKLSLHKNLFHFLARQKEITVIFDI